MLRVCFCPCVSYARTSVFALHASVRVSIVDAYEMLVDAELYPWYVCASGAHNGRARGQGGE